MSLLLLSTAAMALQVPINCTHGCSEIFPGQYLKIKHSPAFQSGGSKLQTLSAP